MKLTALFFSTTKTTEKITLQIFNKIASSFDSSLKQNLAEISPDKRSDFVKSLKFNENDLLLFAVPVYSGRIPTILLSDLNALNGNNAKVVPIVVYGNREYDDALLELSDIMEKRKFKNISAAAFIGEHSFSTDQMPIAKNRPDDKDLVEADNFAIKTLELFKKSQQDHKKIIKLNIPGNHPYKKKKASNLENFIKVNSKCNSCGICEKICPQNAVMDGSNPENAFQADPKKCIACCACIKYCPQKARSIGSDFMLGVQKKLFNNCQTHKEPAFFY